MEKYGIREFCNSLIQLEKSLIHYRINWIRELSNSIGELSYSSREISTIKLERALS